MRKTCQHVKKAKFSFLKNVDFVSFDATRIEYIALSELFAGVVDNVQIMSNLKKIVSKLKKVGARVEFFLKFAVIFLRSLLIPLIPPLIF